MLRKYRNGEKCCLNYYSVPFPRRVFGDDDSTPTLPPGYICYLLNVLEVATAFLSNLKQVQWGELNTTKSQLMYSSFFIFYLS
jgi:hypothetical protein